MASVQPYSWATYEAYRKRCAYYLSQWSQTLRPTPSPSPEATEILTHVTSEAPKRFLVAPSPLPKHHEDGISEQKPLLGPSTRMPLSSASLTEKTKSLYPQEPPNAGTVSSSTLKKPKLYVSPAGQPNKSGAVCLDDTDYAKALEDDASSLLVIEHAYSLMNIEIKHKTFCDTFHRVIDEKKLKIKEMERQQIISGIDSTLPVESDEKYSVLIEHINGIADKRKQRLQTEEEARRCEMKKKEEERIRKQTEQLKKEAEEKRRQEEQRKLLEYKLKQQEEEKMKLALVEKQKLLASQTPEKAAPSKQVSIETKITALPPPTEAPETSKQSQAATFPPASSPFMKEAFDTISKLHQYEMGEYQRVVQCTDPKLKDIRISIKRKMNTFINQIANTQQQVMRSCKEFLLFFKSLNRSDGHLLHFAFYVCVELFLKRCDSGGQITINPNSVWSYAVILAKLMEDYPMLKDIFCGSVYKVCCYSVPFYYRKLKGMSTEEYYALIQRAPSDTEEMYFNRMASYLRLWIAWLITRKDWSSVWLWMARFLNLSTKHPRRVSATLLWTALTISAHNLIQVYKRQYIKLLDYINHFFIPKLKKLKEENPAIITSTLSRLEGFLEECFSNGYRIPVPEGKEMKVREVETDES